MTLPAHVEPPFEPMSGGLGSTPIAGS